jgi:hypothetical protein
MKNIPIEKMCKVLKLVKRLLSMEKPIFLIEQRVVLVKEKITSIFLSQNNVTVALE